MAAKGKSTHQNHPTGIRTTDTIDGAGMLKTQRFVTAAFLVLVLLRLIAAFFPKERLWGLNHLAYLPMWLTLLLTAVALLSCTPLAARLTRDFTNQLYKLYSRLTARISRTIVYVLLSLGFALLCWSFPIQFPFLGDGPQSLIYIGRALIGDQTSPTSLTRLESLTSLVYLDLSRLAPATTDIRTASLYVELVYRIVGAVLGGMFFFLVLTVARHATRQLPEKVIAVVTLVSSAGTLFFFGYIEYYAFVYVSIALYCLSAVAYFEGRVKIVVPVVAFVLSVGFHFLALALLPSLLYVLLSQWSRRARLPTFRRSLIVISISAVVLFLIYLLARSAPESSRPLQIAYFFIPLLANGQYTYTLLSRYHLIDFVNEQLLVSQIGLVFLGAAVFFLRKKIDWDRPSYIFLLFSASYLVIMNLSANTAYNIGIDWDIFAVVGLVFTLLGIYLIVPLIQKSQWRWNVASMVVGSAVISTLPWIVVNVKGEYAVERFKNLVELDAARMPVWPMEYRYETVRKYYQKHKQEAEEFDIIQKLITYTRGDPSECDKLLRFIPGKNSTKYQQPFLRAVDSLSEAVQESLGASTATTESLPLNEKTHLLHDVYARYLIFGAATYGLKIEERAEQFRKSFPQLPQGYEIMGWYYLLKDNHSAALESFQQSYARDTLRPNTLIGLGKIFYYLGTQTAQRQEFQTYASEALHFYERAIAIEPQPWVAIYGELGYLYLSFGQSVKAREYFERYLEMDNTSTYAKGIRQELSRLQSGEQRQ